MIIFIVKQNHTNHQPNRSLFINRSNYIELRDFNAGSSSKVEFVHCFEIEFNINYSKPKQIVLLDNSL